MLLFFKLISGKVIKNSEYLTITGKILIITDTNHSLVNYRENITNYYFYKFDNPIKTTCL